MPERKNVLPGILIPVVMLTTVITRPFYCARGVCGYIERSQPVATLSNRPRGQLVDVVSYQMPMDRFSGPTDNELSDS